MTNSPLQEAFLREFVLTFKATRERIRAQLEEELPADLAARTDAAVADQLEGLCQGLLVIFDGGSALADEGLISIVGEEGHAFDRNLHEQCPHYWNG